MKNPHFGYDKRSTGGDFLIDHFAGDVVYSCHRFLDKNRDTLSPGTLAGSGLLCCSWCHLVGDASAWFASRELTPCPPGRVCLNDGGLLVLQTLCS